MCQSFLLDPVAVIFVRFDQRPALLCDARHTFVNTTWASSLVRPTRGRYHSASSVPILGAPVRVTGPDRSPAGSFSAEC